jgi:hypothetical protein
MTPVRQVLADLTDAKLTGITEPVTEPGCPEPESFPDCPFTTSADTVELDVNDLVRALWRPTGSPWMGRSTR